MPNPWAGASSLGLIAGAVDYADKYRGALIGGAIGDALGRPVEGWPIEAVKAKYGEVRDFEPWSGWQRGPTGTVTDDTQMTMCVAGNLVQHGCIEPADLAARFVEWFPHGRGKGQTTTHAVRRLIQGLPWHEAGVSVSAASNGAAMRVAPVGLAYPLDIDNLRRNAALSAVITHADPVAVVSAVAQAFGVAWCLHREPGTLQPHELLEDMAAVLADLVDPAYEERRPDRPVRVTLRDRLLDVGSHLDDSPDRAFAYFHNGAFVLESLPAAWWCFLHCAEDPEQVLVTGASGGRDADTVAAMAGNLVGAYHGERALPARWREELEFAHELRSLGRELLGVAELDAH